MLCQMFINLRKSTAVNSSNITPLPFCLLSLAEIPVSYVLKFFSSITSADLSEGLISMVLHFIFRILLSF